MSLRRIFLDDYRETKQEIRNRIEQQAEPAFEIERDNGFAEGSLEFGEDISNMSNSDKEAIRIESLRDLNDYRKEIDELWTKQIERTARFQIGTNIFLYVGLLATILMLICREFTPAVVMAIVVIIIFLISRVGPLYAIFTFVLTGTWITSDKLLILYRKYGRAEAALKFADYRGFSRSHFEDKSWIFSTNHRVSP